MFNQIFFASPLEQFQIIPIISLQLGFLDFSITNETIILIVVLFLCIMSIFSLLKEDNTFFIKMD